MKMLEMSKALKKRIFLLYLDIIRVLIRGLLFSCLHSYDECVGPGSSQIYLPTDDPPPYSLLDPCQRGSEEEGQPDYSQDGPAYYGGSSEGAAWFSPSHYPLGLQQQEQQHIASISFPQEAAPSYESVLAQQGQPLPLMPCALYKHQSERGDDGNSPLPGLNHILQDN